MDEVNKEYFDLVQMLTLKNNTSTIMEEVTRLVIKSDKVAKTNGGGRKKRNVGQQEITNTLKVDGSEYMQHHYENESISSLESTIRHLERFPRDIETMNNYIQDKKKRVVHDYHEARS